MKLTGAKIFVECLQAEGVDTIFGYPGGAVLFIYDELYKHEDEHKTKGEPYVKHILARHEQGAVHAAEGYAKSTDKPGVVIVTSGPGATNAVTGIADAYMDSVPLVVFTGQVISPLIGNDAFQEVDTVGITRPCVKHNFLVKDVKDLARTIKEAFFIATTGRPGPVVVDIPKDITAHECEFHYPETVNIRSYDPTFELHLENINRAVAALLSAKRPIIYTGGGVISSRASEELIEFAHMLGYPVTNTLMGLGAFPAADDLFVGMLGMHGTVESNRAMYHADLVISIGARFDDRVTGVLEKFCPEAKIIHVDIDPTSISKNVVAHIPLIGDAKTVLQALIAGLKDNGQKPDAKALKAWWAQIEVWREEWNAVVRKNVAMNSENLPKPQTIIERLCDMTHGDAYVAADVGQHQMWAAQFYKFNKPNRWINSGGLGTMGFGLPAAMGVQIAHPDATVCCISGDGSIQMCIQELSTCLQYGLPLKIIVLNNQYLGMVRQWQEFFYAERYAMSYMKSVPNFAGLAKAYGHVGIRVNKPAEIDAALHDALETHKHRLVLIEFAISQKENVFPMIPAGAGHNEIMLEAPNNSNGDDNDDNRNP